MLAVYGVVCGLSRSARSVGADGESFIPGFPANNGQRTAHTFLTIRTHHTNLINSAWFALLWRQGRIIVHFLPLQVTSSSIEAAVVTQPPLRSRVHPRRGARSEADEKNCEHINQARVGADFKCAGTDGVQSLGQLPMRQCFCHRGLSTSISPASQTPASQQKN